MPQLIIDRREIEVPAGTKVIEAAARLGIIIPRFCYHPALGSVGACRVCAVKFLEGPVKGVEMSCMTAAQDGMVVSTTHPEAMEFRRYVIEWLMLHHPHDCPVCDEGGHCLLQDETVSGGHGLRRYLGLKRTYRDQYLGAFVQHEMNRCIHCWRCRRFYQDFAGYRDYGVMQIGNRTYFGRFADGPLESPFAGNLIDLCPTGVLTDKPARFKGRRWDLERAPSLCLHCSLGCNITGSARYREMIRVEGRLNEAVNGYFICDRGRFGFAYANHPERARTPRLDGQEVTWEEACRTAAHRLTRISREYGPGAIAVWGSTRSSLATLGVLQRLCREQGWLGPQFFNSPSRERKVKAAISRLDAGVAVSLADLEKADFLLVAGADPVNEAPMLALGLRQAWRRGATVVVLDPRPVHLPLEFEHLPVPPGGIDLCLDLLVRAAVSHSATEGLLPEAAAAFFNNLSCEYPGDQPLQDRLVSLGMKLKESKNPVIVCGLDIVRESTVVLAADHSRLLRAAKDRAGLFYLLPGPNAFGAGLLSLAGEPSSPSYADMLAAAEQGRIKALVMMETDPFRTFAGQPQFLAALDRLEFLLVLDYLPTPLTDRVQFFLPTTTVFEEEPSGWVNQEGRCQQAAPIYVGGRPISQEGAGSHPPRVFLAGIPGGEPQPGGQTLAALGVALKGTGAPLYLEELDTWLAELNPVFAPLLESKVTHPGVRLLPEARGDYAFSHPNKATLRDVPDDHLELLLVDWTFGTEELSGYAPPTQEVEQPPRLTMQSRDALRLGLGPGDRVSLALGGESITLDLEIVENMASGMMVLPRHRQLAGQKFPEGPILLPLQNIHKV
ncbi:MAG: NADH-quinone oxidoreductase subunit NuoG [Syntrophales bacterium]|nr:NADH-quinone oxidoreductase subunit NuoG [Syntrophales bacterium]